MPWAVVSETLICFLLLPEGHYETTNSTCETRCGGRCPQSNMPREAAKSQFISFYSSTRPSLPRLVSDLHQNTPALDFVALKKDEISPRFKPSYRLMFFLPPLSVITICVGYLPFHCLLLIPHCPKLFHTGFSLSCISQLSSALQHGTKHGQRNRAECGCMSPKKPLIYLEFHI